MCRTVDLLYIGYLFVYRLDSSLLPTKNFSLRHTIPSRDAFLGWPYQIVEL